MEEFIEKYQLRESEVAALREGEVNDGFFSALERVQKIHQDCKGLLQSGESIDDYTMSSVVIVAVKVCSTHCTCKNYLVAILIRVGQQEKLLYCYKYCLKKCQAVF